MAMYRQLLSQTAAYLKIKCSCSRDLRNQR